MTTRSTMELLLYFGLYNCHTAPSHPGILLLCFCHFPYFFGFIPLPIPGFVRSFDKMCMSVCLGQTRKAET
jgi:hypothetical protein